MRLSRFSWSRSGSRRQMNGTTPDPFTHGGDLECKGWTLYIHSPHRSNDISRDQLRLTPREWEDISQYNTVIMDVWRFTRSIISDCLYYDKYLMGLLVKSNFFTLSFRVSRLVTSSFQQLNHRRRRWHGRTPFRIDYLFPHLLPWTLPLILWSDHPTSTADERGHDGLFKSFRWKSRCRPSSCQKNS